MNKLAIHSAPRSGSTWLGNIINSHPNVNFKYQPLFSYKFKSYLTEKSSAEEINMFYKLINDSKDSFLGQKEAIKNGLVPEFKKNKFTHICYKEVRYHYILNNLMKKDLEIKLILLIRNPLSVLYSWKNAPKEFNAKDWDFNEEWLNARLKNKNKSEEFYGYEKWKELALLFHDLQIKYPKNIYLINYNDLLLNTPEITKSIFDFSDLDITNQTLEFIKNSKNKHHDNAYSVYKKKDSDKSWKSLPSNIINYINNDLSNTFLKKYLNE